MGETREYDSADACLDVPTMFSLLTQPVVYEAGRLQELNSQPGWVHYHLSLIGRQECVCEWNQSSGGDSRALILTPSLYEGIE